MLAMLMLLMVASPFASAATTETQFTNGSTSYTHTFTGTGTGAAGDITLPIGADVTSASFEMEGAPTSSTWSNLTTDRDFGGEGTGSWSGSPPGLSTGYRTNLEVRDDEVTLRGNPSQSLTNFGSVSSLASTGTGTLNTTGRFVANGDQGFLGSTVQPSASTLTGGNWNYMGTPLIDGTERLVLRWTSTSFYNSPDIQRWGEANGTYLGRATLNVGTCTSSAYRYIYDATLDPQGNLWTVSYNYRAVTKWAPNGDRTQWVCQQSNLMTSPAYPAGIDFDEATGKLYLLIYTSSSPDYPHYLYEVSSSDPTSINGTWFLGNRDRFYVPGTTTSTITAGLVVQMPKIVTNHYQTSGSRQSFHHHWSMSSSSVTWMGSQTLAYGHYGMNEEDGQISYSCHYNCQARRIHHVGSGAPTDTRTPVASTSVILSATTTLGTSVDEVRLSSAVAWVPTGTSATYQISNDGGTTWASAAPGDLVTFGQVGNLLRWRAYLNGTSAVSPILDFVALETVTSYQPSGEFYIRSNYLGTTGTYPVAATAWWNSSVPTGTSLTVRFQTGSSCYSGTSTTFTSSGDTITISGTSTYYSICVQFRSNSPYGATPTLEDLNVQFHTNAPTNVKLDLGADGTNEWTRTGTFIGSATASGGGLADALDALIPDIGSGTATVPVSVKSDSAGILRITSFQITYVMQTVNLELSFDPTEVLHERDEPYEITTRHVIGESATRIDSASLTLIGTPTPSSPTLNWEYGDVWPDANDPDDWIDIHPSSSSSTANGITTINWRFTVNSGMTDQNAVRFRVTSTDDVLYTPSPLTSTETMTANQTYGLGWLMVADTEGEVTRDDVPDHAWVEAGETLYFSGQMWFVGTEDAPRNGIFDVRISLNGYVDNAWRDTTNPNGTFFIPVTVPSIDVDEGLTYEVQIYNERETSRVMPSDATYRRTIKVDATAPVRGAVQPMEGDYEAAGAAQVVSMTLTDAIGSPTSLDLMYWVEADHDRNRNGEADASEYARRTVTNTTSGSPKRFTTTIDHQNNPNMARVSYYWSGGDEAGNVLKYVTGYDDEGEPSLRSSGPGFANDDATFLTRKDSTAVFTGLDWVGHEDGGTVYAGLTQHLEIGLIDANTVVDFEVVSLTFDFEGPDPVLDRQVVAFSGLNETFWSESPYLTLLPTSNVVTTVNGTGLPFIRIGFDLVFGWDWPDEEVSDVAVTYKERGAAEPTHLPFSNRTFRVENDLVLSPGSFSIEDVSEPRTGPIADGSRVRHDDRLQFSGRVVYENSDVAAPRNVGIQVDVFDGVAIWSDGSLGSDGSYSVEVPLSAATSLRNSPMRSCLVAISGIPGAGQDMTGNSVSTTVQVIVDANAPRVVQRDVPVNVIDLGVDTDLTSIPVEFQGSEDADLTGSPQFVNWIILDATRTLTVGSGSSSLGMQHDGLIVRWTGTVDLTDGGRLTPQEGDWVGFFLTGNDAAGNEFPRTSNSEASPIPESLANDTDSERQWVRLGFTGPQLKAVGLTVSDDHVAPNARLEVVGTITNLGGAINESFTIAFLAGEDVIETQTINGLGEGESLTVTIDWRVDGASRIRMVVDHENVISEVNEADNTVEQGIEIAYASFLGWVDSPREHPLTWIYMIVAVVVIGAVVTIARRTSLEDMTSLFQEEYYDDEEWEDDEEFDEDDD